MTSLIRRRSAAPGGGALAARQMVGAEILKLWRNRAILGFAFVLSVVIVMIYFGYNAVEHASNPAQYPPAGGIGRFSRAVRVLGLFFGALTAVLIGSEAGTADLSSGVFRDLVATGRSRLSLFFVRAPAAIVDLPAGSCSATRPSPGSPSASARSPGPAR